MGTARLRRSAVFKYITFDDAWTSFHFSFLSFFFPPLTGVFATMSSTLARRSIYLSLLVSGALARFANVTRRDASEFQADSSFDVQALYDFVKGGSSDVLATYPTCNGECTTGSLSHPLKSGFAQTATIVLRRSSMVILTLCLD